MNPNIHQKYPSKAKQTCPYTWVLRFLGLQGQTKAESTQPKTIEPHPYYLLSHGPAALRIIEGMGNCLMDPLITSHTGNMGNVPARPETSFSIPQRVSHIQHVGLRAFVAGVGSMLDISRFSHQTQQTIVDFRSSIDAYKETVQPFIDMASYYKIQYTDLTDIVVSLDRPERYPDIGERLIQLKEQVKISNEKSAEKLDRLKFYLQNEPYFYQKNNPCAIPNSPYLFEGTLYPAHIFYISKLAAKGILDTTKNPPCLTKHIQQSLGVTRTITSNMVTMVNSLPEEAKRPIYVLAQTTCETIQQRITRLGLYEDIVREMGGSKMSITHLGLDDPAVFAYIKQGAGAAASIEPKEARGKCPFHPTGV